MTHSRAAIVIATCLLLASCRVATGPAGGPSVDLAAAVRAALAHSPGTAVQAEMKTKDGAIRYEVKVLAADGSVTEVDLGGSGQVERKLPWNQDAPEWKPKIAAAAGASTVELSAALATALAASPGTALSADLESKDGAPRWEFEVAALAGKKGKVVVDARTGQILR